jgi:glycosyltransferase involved in cell wall biosynthesis
MIGFTIIICTYNPNPYIYRRLLFALSRLADKGSVYEILLVDNNSSSFIGASDYVQDFVSNPINNARILTETNPGLTSARLKGISVAQYDWLIFFDDDNEPDENYLINCSAAITKFKKVCAWGPGVVRVEYMKENISNWFNDNKRFYQNNFIEEVLFDNKSEWCSCYPNGTGLVIRKDVALAYTDLIEKGELTLTDRIGKSLVSGGDTQMVLCGIKLGYYAGISPLLKLNHLIAENKINIKYLLRQSYMTASCYVKAYNEIKFVNKQIPITLEGNKRALEIIYNACRLKLFRGNLNDFLLHLYKRLGEFNARYYASNNIRKPILIKMFEKFIDV